MRTLAYALAFALIASGAFAKDSWRHQKPPKSCDGECFFDWCDKQSKPVPGTGDVDVPDACRDK
jgi:hypothetical protein